MGSGILTTKVSTKGQVILPKAVRDQKHWGPGTTLQVEIKEDGILLKPVPIFAPTKPEDVCGMLRYVGPTKTIDDMNDAITKEVKERHARGRY